MSAARQKSALVPAANELDPTLVPAVAANEPMNRNASLRPTRREYVIVWAPAADPARGEAVLTTWLRSLSCGISAVDCDTGSERQEGT